MRPVQWFLLLVSINMVVLPPLLSVCPLDINSPPLSLELFKCSVLPSGDLLEERFVESLTL